VATISFGSIILAGLYLGSSQTLTPLQAETLRIAAGLAAAGFSASALAQVLPVTAWYTKALVVLASLSTGAAAFGFAPIKPATLPEPETQAPPESLAVPVPVQPVKQAPSQNEERRIVPALISRKDLTTDIAFSIAKGAVSTCKSQGYNISVTVIGREGAILVAMRGDDTGPHTLEYSMKKAYTALAQRQPSGDFAKAVKDNPTAGALHLTNLLPAQGALPIRVGNDVIGAIGVSGAPGGDKDEACASAGLGEAAASLK
jgi:uncharacterized protein GlcG (DUF336 family)